MRLLRDTGLFFTLLLILAIHFIAGPYSARSQDAVIWSNPKNLSNSPSGSNHPAIVADDFGFVHVFWSEEVNGEPVADSDPPDLGNAIMYTRWDGNRWTVPVDVLASPGGGIAEFIAVDVDAAGRLYAVWGGQSRFYFSSANVWEADNAQAWSEPETIASGNARSQWESGIVATDDGLLHVVYATKDPSSGIYHISSPDGGQTWSREKQISLSLEKIEGGFANARIISDAKGRLHVTWQTFTEGKGVGQGVYYARSIDDGSTWSDPRRFDFREEEDEFVEWPYLTSRGEDELHLNYVHGRSRGRAYRISQDGGETWSEAEEILLDMEGINGYVIPLVDGKERMHMVVNMRTQAGQVVGLYYSRQLPQGGWSSTTPIDNFSPGAPAAHYTAAVNHRGNEIHAVYAQLFGAEIWYVRGEIQDVEPRAAKPIPQEETSMAVEDEAGEQIEESESEAIVPTYEFDREASSSGNPFSSLYIAGAAALVFVMIFALVKAFRR